MENKYSLRRVVSYSCLGLFARLCILMLKFSTISVQSELIKMFGVEPDNGFVWMRFESNFLDNSSDIGTIVLLTVGPLSIAQLIIGISVLASVVSNFLKEKDDVNKKPIVWGFVSMSLYALEGIIIKFVCNSELPSYVSEYINTSSFIPLIIGVALVIGYNLSLKYLPDAGFSSSGVSSKTSPALNEVAKMEALSKYKGLLDNGIITQEEFDAKKKQLLGL